MGTLTQAQQGDRARRVRTLAERAAEEAVRSGRRVALSAMTGDERDLVREQLRWRADVATLSEGDGADRHVVIIPI